LAGFLKILFIYLFLSLLLGYIPINTGFKQSAEGTEIFIVSNGVHTDFVLPMENDLMNWRLFFNLKDFGRSMEMASHIAFGWGDQGFYLNTPEWSDLRLKTALVALCVPSRSAMHVSLWNQPETDTRTVKIMVNKVQYLRIIDYIRNSFVLNPDGQPIRLDHPGYGNYDLFYESGLAFHLIRTCNVWTNTGLIRSGIRTSLWTPFDRPILYQLSSIE
jgi:uncharacterized protein (TIGR02117 family)